MITTTLTRTVLRTGRSLLPGFASLLFLVVVGCEYEAPLTTQPTRATQEKLVGTWISDDGKDTMVVRRFDQDRYAVSYNGDLYAAHHSDFDAVPLVSVLHLDSDNRKYALVKWSLSDDAQVLRLRVVSSKVVETTARDSATLQSQVRQNLDNPRLFGAEFRYTRKP